MEYGGAALLATTLVVLLFGGLVTTVTVRAARRTGATALWILACGIALITVGAVMAELVLLGIPEPSQAIAVGVGAVIATGFVALAYSIYGGYS